MQNDFVYSTNIINLLEILLPISMITWYFPVIAFRNNKFFFFFYLNSLVEPVFVLLKHLFNIHVYNYIPYVILFESATLPTSDLKSKTISSIALIMIVLNLGSHYLTELIVCTVVLTLMIYNLIQNLYLDFKKESVLKLYYLLLITYFLLNMMLTYVYYTNQTLIIKFPGILFITLILIPLLISLIGPDKSIFINTNTTKIFQFINFGKDNGFVKNSSQENDTNNSPDLKSISRDKIFINPSTHKKSPDGLTEREYEICLLLGKGLTSAEIAQKLFLSKRTVDNHRAAIKEKLGVSKRSEIIERLQKNFLAE